jgi:UDP-N-acetylglucosamine 2-epimerase (non-hydrolysing)
VGETVEDGWNVLVGADYGGIVDAIAGFAGADGRSDVFGMGDARVRVCEVLRSLLS